MKRYIRSSINNTTSIMKSKDGMYELVEFSGVEVNQTPFRGLKVIGDDDAEFYNVKVVLEADYSDFRGYNGPDHPVVYNYVDVDVVPGPNDMLATLPYVKRYIKVLQSAVDFAEEVKKYIQTEWK